MSPLSNADRELVFGYCIGITPADQLLEAEELIANNDEARRLAASVRRSLSPLETVEIEPCPDELVEGTVWKLKQAAEGGDASQATLESLLADEQQRSAAASVAAASSTSDKPEITFWGDMFRRLATAAAFIIVGSVLITSYKVMSGYARQSAQRQVCKKQLSNIFQGINSYANDNDGKQPMAAGAANTPWWMLGKQTQEDASNTRHMWRVVKNGYVDAADFICPGSPQDKLPEIDPAQIQNYYDFPSRNHITYSIKIQCARGNDGRLLCRKVLLADVSPLFEKLPENFDKPFRLKLDNKLLTVNSQNHDRHGQSVLFGDGSVAFRKDRTSGYTEDDIYTLQSTDVYEGYERPRCIEDQFVAP